ncbi:hypothetical protein FNJ88_03415 [Chryseobacterium sp. SNU WT5]|uniref:hypothetical protein n=1 Tax=Chryseobacterium sp. SNU WT5 TaxID=2594269 RepID=UPI00117D5380|nr:hypothetical protein [Chryseobacterium sp. SNU WT5]QDP84640.1 hypothetical protein FNJ88_03415 [Chryseobacterium sp. SNU WT5]
MKRKLHHLLCTIILIFNLSLVTSCSNREDTINCFPKTPINVVLNLNLPAYFNLQNTGGWIYIDEQQAGTRGLIIVRTTNGFLAFDRNAPHICPGSDTTLSVEGNIKIVCPKDGAEWILFTGEPTKIAQVPPKTYPYSYDSNSNTLSIYY